VPPQGEFSSRVQPRAVGSVLSLPEPRQHILRDGRWGAMWRRWGQKEVAARSPRRHCMNSAAA
jgi:hypothetical protein